MSNDFLPLPNGLVIQISKETNNNKEEAKLPLFLRDLYSFIPATLGNKKLILIKPKKNISTQILLKQFGVIERFLPKEIQIILWDPENRIPSKSALIYSGLPFIEKHFFNLPFLGLLWNDKGQVNRPVRSELSFLTQKFLLTFIYSNATEVSGSQVARMMGISRMSAIRIFNELETILGLTTSKAGTARLFIWTKRKAVLWDKVKVKLRNPIKEEFLLPGDSLKGITLPYGGISALAYYSALADDMSTFATTTRDFKSRIEKEKKITPQGVYGKRVQVLGYLILGADGKAIDPLSATLTLSSEQKEQPRIREAIKEIERRYLK